MQKIGDILNTNAEKDIITWKPPQKQERRCRFCDTIMNANKISFKGFNGEERFLYQYSCPNNCEEKYRQRQEHAKRYRVALKVWQKVGLTRECVGWTLDKMTCENIEYLREYANSFNRFSKALVLKGSKGTGKTLSSECIAKKLTHNGFRCRLTNMTEINIEMNQALRKDKYKEYLDGLMKLDLIVIDDFLRETYTTEKSLENVFQFFNTMIRERKPFIVSVNPENLAIMSNKPQLDALFDRFRDKKRVEILNFKGNSFRK